MGTLSLLETRNAENSTEEHIATSDSDSGSKAILESVRKSKLNAKDSFDFQYLMHESPFFLKADIQDEGETVLFSYDAESRKSVAGINDSRSEEIADELGADIEESGRNKGGIREEDTVDRLTILQSVGRLEEAAKLFKFTLRPENLYYDAYGLAAIRSRDLYGNSEEMDSEDFLARYKALVGYAMQDKYSFDDYYEGGGSLFAKNKFLKRVAQTETVSELVDVLSEKRERIKADRKENYDLFPRKYFNVIKMAALLFGIGFVVAMGVICDYFGRVEKEERYMEALIDLSEGFEGENYTACIKSMKDIPIEVMPTYHRYMLAKSYAYESTSDLTKEGNPFAALTKHDKKERFDYWIYLGKNEPDTLEEAHDIADRMSDEELLLYATVKWKTKAEEEIDKHTGILGKTIREKYDKVRKDCQNEIKELCKKYTEEKLNDLYSRYTYGEYEINYLDKLVQPDEDVSEEEDVEEGD